MAGKRLGDKKSGGARIDEHSIPRMHHLGRPGRDALLRLGHQGDFFAVHMLEGGAVIRLDRPAVGAPKRALTIQIIQIPAHRGL